MVFPKMRKMRYQDFTKQSVLPLMKKPASSRSPTKSHTSLFVTQWSAVTAPLWPLRTRILLWTFFCPAEDKSCRGGVPLSLVAKSKRKKQTTQNLWLHDNINPQNLDESYIWDIPPSEDQRPLRPKLILADVSLLNMLWTQLLPTTEASAGCWFWSDPSLGRGDGNAWADMDWDLTEESPQ